MKLGEALYKAQQPGGEGRRRGGGESGPGGGSGTARPAATRRWSMPTSRKSTTARASRPLAAAPKTFETGA